MQQSVSENIIMLFPGESIPPDATEAISILLLGSSDATGNPKYDWPGNFARALAEITDPLKGILQFQGLKFVILNGATPAQNPEPGLMNQEFTDKTNWILSMINTPPADVTNMDAQGGCDAVFINFLRGGTAPYPLYYLGLCANSGKMCCRCSENSIYYPYVYLAAKQYGFPLLPSKVTSALSILQSLQLIIPKFQNIGKYQLPE